MARTIGKLTALAVAQANRRGYYGDGGGLFLQVSASGAKSWVFRFKEAGRLREMGLGPTHTVEPRRGAAESARMPQGASRRPTTRSSAAGRKRIAGEARRRQGDDLRGMRRALHRLAQGRLAKSEARRAMAGNARNLCLSGLRRAAGAGGRRRARDEGDRADLDARSRKQRAGCAAGSRASSIGRRPAAIARARTRRAGAAISKTCLPKKAKVRRVEHHAALPYAGDRRLSWPSCGSRRVSPPARSNLRS